MRSNAVSDTKYEYVGFCPDCGGQLFASQERFTCENTDGYNCKFHLKRKYFIKFGNSNPITISQMRCLILGGGISLFGLISQKSGKPFNCVGFLNYSQEGSWWIRFDFEHFALGVYRQIANSRQ